MAKKGDTRFYVKVSGMEGSRQPHFDLAEAYIEARRLFDLNGRTRRVYILEAIGMLAPEVVEEKQKAA